ncbi:MAG TPA: hypothetical protein VNI61_00640 [Gemmatimonadales bacterium]|nr:hypothetical protein [Gemmatimonadales bacterium]
MPALHPFTGKVTLDPADRSPLCPWCDGLLDRLRWHKVRGGPPVGYLIVLSCGHCGGVVDCAAGHGYHGG